MMYNYSLLEVLEKEKRLVQEVRWRKELAREHKEKWLKNKEGILQDYYRECAYEYEKEYRAIKADLMETRKIIKKYIKEL